MRSSFSLSAVVQYETWTFPVIASTQQSDVATSVQLTFWPKGFLRKNSSTIVIWRTNGAAKKMATKEITKRETHYHRAGA